LAKRSAENAIMIQVTRLRFAVVAAAALLA